MKPEMEQFIKKRSKQNNLNLLLSFVPVRQAEC